MEKVFVYGKYLIRAYIVINRISNKTCNLNYKPILSVANATKKRLKNNFHSFLLKMCMSFALVHFPTLFDCYATYR